MSAEPRYTTKDGWTWCEDCGCVVVSTGQKAHTRFHAILGDHGRAVAMLLTSHRSASLHDRYDVIDRYDENRNTNNWSAEAFEEVTGIPAVRPPSEGTDE